MKSAQRLTGYTPLYVTAPHTKKLHAALAVQRAEHVSHVMEVSVLVVSVPAIRFASPHHVSVKAMAPTGGAVAVGVTAVPMITSNAESIRV